MPAPGVLSNDIDFDGDPVTAALVANVSRGTLLLDGDQWPAAKRQRRPHLRHKQPCEGPARV